MEAERNKVKVFGCRAVGYVPAEKYEKEYRFRERHVAGVYLGYRPESREFLLLTGPAKVTAHSHARFFEDEILMKDVLASAMADVVFRTASASA